MPLGIPAMTHKQFVGCIGMDRGSHALYIGWWLTIVWRRRYMIGKLINKVNTSTSNNSIIIKFPKNKELLHLSGDFEGLFLQ